MRRLTAVAAFSALTALAGCASPAPPPRPLPPAFDTVRRVAVVAHGETAFTVVEHRSEPGRTFDEVVKWTPYPWLRSLGSLVHSGINWLLDAGRGRDQAADAAGISPRAIVTEVFVQRLQATGWFDDVRALSAEPLGDERRAVDGIVRVSVPAWGLVRVREGPDLLSAFADVNAQMARPGTGVVMWETRLDVTDPERLPPDWYRSDREFTRQQLRAVLERAGHRLASEFLYARGGSR